MNLISKINFFFKNLFSKEELLSIESVFSISRKELTPANKNTLRVFREKGCDCVSCGRKGFYFKKNGKVYNLYSKDGVLMTKDHIIPQSKGGSNSLINLVPMCCECNHNKGNKILKDLKIVKDGKDYTFILLRFAKINRILKKNTLSSDDIEKVKKFISFLFQKKLIDFLSDKEIEMMKNIKMNSLHELKKINGLILSRI